MKIATNFSCPLRVLHAFAAVPYRTHRRALHVALTKQIATADRKLKITNLLGPGFEPGLRVCEALVSTNYATSS